MPQQIMQRSAEREGRAAKTALFDEFARLAQALANGRRLEIVDILANGERTVDRLAAETDLSVANASQHLQVLREVGLVRRRRDGTRIYYELRDAQVFAYCRGPYCAFAHKAVRILQQAGFRARRLEEGLPEWKAAGLPVAIGERRS